MGNASQVTVQKPWGQGRTQHNPHLWMVTGQVLDHGAGAGPMAKPMGADAGVEQHCAGGR